MDKKSIIIAMFIIVKLVLQLLIPHPVYELHRDEFLHLDQANHLAWGYASVPPVTSWISYLIKLLGNGEWWIRLFPALFGAITILLVCKTIETLKGGLFAIILGASCVLCSVMLRLNGLYQPNSLDVLCWTGVYFCLVKYIVLDKSKWLFIGAVIFAVGFLNKYNIGFLLPGIMVALLLSPQRKIFLRRELYLAAGLALVLISPNLVWQYQQHFPVIKHMQELKATQLIHVNRADFLVNQLLFFPGGTLVLVTAFGALLFYKPFRQFRFFVLSFFITIAAFLYFHAKHYYAIGLYPIYFSFGAVFLERVFERKWGVVLRPASIALVMIFILPMVKVALPNHSPGYISSNRDKFEPYGVLRWEDGKTHEIPQDYADMLGWKELACKTDSLYALVAPKGNTVVICDNYGQAGAVNYYTRQGIRAVSFNADYINWFKLDSPYINLIRVISPRDINTEMQKLSPHFRQSFIAGNVTNKFAIERGTAIVGFVNVGTSLNINDAIRDEIAKKKTTALR